MSADDANFFGWAALVFLWAVWTFVSWVLQDSEERVGWPWGIWAVAHVVGLLAFGIWGVTR